jgi:uncharacterized RDD family membrane protein YckC
MPDSPSSSVSLAALSGTPSVKRRLLSMVYESFLLLAVTALTTALFILVTQNHQGPAYQYGLMAALFVIIGVYFIYNWTNSGHTLAMKTWRLCVLGGADGKLSVWTAALRYLFAWGWLLPAFAVRTLFGLHGKAGIAAIYALGIAAWALTAFLDKDRQFLHDRLAGTRVVQLPKAGAKPAADAVRTANA